MNSSTRWLLPLVLTLLFVHSASAVYDPRLGRWLSRDPLGEEGGLNLYAYCGNDPVNRHDPLGLMTDEERVGLQSTNAKLMEIVGLLGGKAWTPEEVFNEKLKTTGFGLRNSGMGFYMYMPMLWDTTYIGLDNKAQLRAQYPWWESDHDVALRESVRSNTVQVKSLLALSNALPERERTALQLRVAFGMWELTSIAATIPFQVPSAAGMPWVGKNLASNIGSRSFLPSGRALEQAVVAEARSIYNSPKMGQLRAAFAAGNSITIQINGRPIQLVPKGPFSGFTNFRGKGFALGAEAFSSEAELQKTLLHELHRLTFSNISRTGVTLEIAAKETQAAAAFADLFFEQLSGQ